VSEEELLRFRQDLHVKPELKQLKEAVNVKAVADFAISKGYAVDSSDLAGLSA
jgi:hypothetical protein